MVIFQHADMLGFLWPDMQIYGDFLQSKLKGFVNGVDGQNLYDNQVKVIGTHTGPKIEGIIINLYRIMCIFMKICDVRFIMIASKRFSRH